VSTFGGLDTLFNPAKRHLDEEKLRLQSTREEVGDASGGKRIDLDSGRVKIARGQSNDDATVTGDDVADDSADDGSTGVAVSGDDPADDPAATAVATTAGAIRTDADADSDPAANSPVVAKRGRARHGKATGADDEDTPAARARRRRAAKA
jgi:uncharacterized protein DUF6191